MWQYFIRCINDKYFTFTGRASRKEYWSFSLFSVVFLLLLLFMAALLDEAVGNIGGPNPKPIVTTVALALYSLALFMPGLAVYVRRLHDIGLSGWLALVAILPTVGGVFVLVTALIPSQAGPNKYGIGPETLV